MLGLPDTDMGHRAQSKLVHVYDFSQVSEGRTRLELILITRSGCCTETTRLGGEYHCFRIVSSVLYSMLVLSFSSWFLDNAEVDWTPPSSLLDWMEQARRESKPIVYIGFGSITVPRPNRVVARIVKAVARSQLVIDAHGFC